MWEFVSSPTSPKRVIANMALTPHTNNQFLISCIFVIWFKSVSYGKQKRESEDSLFLSWYPDPGSNRDGSESTGV